LVISIVNKASLQDTSVVVFFAFLVYKSRDLRFAKGLGVAAAKELKFSLFAYSIIYTSLHVPAY
jgi:hypothetical protein